MPVRLSVIVMLSVVYAMTGGVIAQWYLGSNFSVAVWVGYIALYGVEGEVYATDNVCTHGHARLCDGFLEGHEIECPLHQGRFDVRSGLPTCEPAAQPIRVYATRIDNGRVWIELGDAA